jgi:cytoplasmic iron level regulating protein YaaA (DUF328/UPF0246 family)
MFAWLSQKSASRLSARTVAVHRGFERALQIGPRQRLFHLLGRGVGQELVHWQRDRAVRQRRDLEVAEHQAAVAARRLFLGKGRRGARRVGGPQCAGRAGGGKNESTGSQQGRSLHLEDLLGWGLGCRPDSIPLRSRSIDPADNSTMLFLLSPAKSLDYDTPVPDAVPATQPHFEGARGPSVELIKLLREKSPQQIAELMHLSDKLSSLNVARYAVWASKGTEKNAKQAVLAFDGDVYGGLDAKTLSPAQLGWAQDHLCILSGLYGVLRPLDRLQPYRLEMGTQLANRHGKDLYAFWGTRIADHLNQRLAADRTPVVINVASQEYFKSVDRKVLKARVVECVFEEWKGGRYKIISFFAKRARGLLARWAVLHKAATPGALEKFDLEGYAFDAVASKPERLVFRRRAS